MSDLCWVLGFACGRMKKGGFRSDSVKRIDKARCFIPRACSRKFAYYAGMRANYCAHRTHELKQLGEMLGVGEVRARDQRLWASRR